MIELIKLECGTESNICPLKILNLEQQRSKATKYYYLEIVDVLQRKKDCLKIMELFELLSTDCLTARAKIRQLVVQLHKNSNRQQTESCISFYGRENPKELPYISCVAALAEIRSVILLN